MTVSDTRPAPAPTPEGPVQRSPQQAAYAWLRRTESGIEVELVDGEEGVSPGQACVFYDAADGQARVLGGGFIARAARNAASPERRMTQSETHELIRG